MSESQMKIDSARANALISQLQEVQQRISTVAKGRPVRLVAVSKLKPANDIQALHQPPLSHTHFGENYAQELTQKAALLPSSIQWHFIGGLQTTHCKTLAKIPNLFVVSSIDSIKKASRLNKSRGEFLHEASSTSSSSSSSSSATINGENKIINVHIQVNTSGEESKSGCSPGTEVVDLARHILTECPHLRLLGFMTIGAIARSVATTPETENEDFIALKDQRDLVVKELGDELLGGRELELSMGMSEDFEGAIALGSSEVRVGSTIFGTRPANRADAKIVE
ncbi:hypothetical protein BD289DRAFT_456551 [Coniella lustricola]|uniref:Pyridoxal phosphate homeostasis protein n=1 Tax=Coniella lustricola TaxID=2025994 RepID=A0A2T2ZVE4_9PEZI|nr:hypothetical protein BD289DRAFT_456551 [Coniella lustricola]